MRKLVHGSLTLAALWLSACGGEATGPDTFGPPADLAACTSSPPLTRFPVAVSAVSFIGPLGVMTGGGHLFPATHLGIHLASGIASTPLYAPGSLVIRQVARATYSEPSIPTDYAIFFYPCADVRMHFGHVSALDPSILSEVGAFGASDCAVPYGVGGVTIEPCTKNVSINVAAGARLGTQQYTMDWGATDRRQSLAYVNPQRFGEAADNPFGQNHAVCPVDYLPPAVRDSVHGLFGEGSARRTAEPVCGTVMQDIPATAQGRWFVNDDWNERLHLGLVRDYIDPSIAAFSVGTSIPSLPTQLYRFDPVDAGRVDLDFPHVRADGNIYCYEPTSLSPTSYVVFIQLVSDTRLRIEGSPGASCGAPESWAFTAGAVEFTR